MKQTAKTVCATGVVVRDEEDLKVLNHTHPTIIHAKRNKEITHEVTMAKNGNFKRSSHLGSK